MSKLYFRYGAMNCGKSTNLLQVAHNYEERGMRVLLIKSKIDTKGDSAIISRLGVKRVVDFLAPKGSNIFEYVSSQNSNNKVDCVLVDEAQFFSRDHIEQLFDVAVKLNIPTICYGLRTDFMRNGFTGSTRLLELAHSIEELKTICTCGKKAIFNGRKVNGKFVFEGEQVAIDDNDLIEYQSLCADCYYKNMLEYNNCNK
ncbi:thymidine kinase [Clostridiaceae bacterium M8S5]|nr:thymidine kinase [Clostridiaceae bacterium M8S5]